MDINAMTLSEIEAAIVEKALPLEILKAQRTSMEPKLRALTRETIVLRAKGRMAEASQVLAESHAHSEKMNAIRDQEKEIEEVLDQLKARKKELVEG